jgi:flagellar biosynthetic protein FliR
MSWVIPEDQLVAFGLASIRLIAFVLTAPFFSHAAIPGRVRGALAILLAVALAPSHVDVALNPIALAAAAIGEALIGAALGIAASAPFAALGLAAETASVQGGLGAAAALDPASDASTTALASLAEGVALLVFLAVGGHLELLRGLAQGFAWIPPGGLALDALGRIAELGANVFLDGLRFAAPYTGALLLSNVVVGLLGRTIPQLNLMSVQLPAQIAIVLGLLAIGAAPFCDAVAQFAPHAQEPALALLAGGVR